MKAAARITAALVIIAFLAAVIVPAFRAVNAQGDPPDAWGEFLNPDGSIDWSNLTYIGDVSEPADWMNIEVPGGIQIPLGEAHYSRYVTPSGNVLVLPSPATMFMSFLNPEASGLAGNPPEMLGTGHQMLAALAADYIDPAALQAMGYVDPAEFFQAVINGQENIWSLVSANFLFELVSMSLDSGFLVTSLWLYLSGNCDAVPGGCPDDLAALLTPTADDGVPTPNPSACPPATVTYEDVTVSGAKVAPPYPVVVGQDPEKRGVDIEATVRIPPVILTWYETRSRSTCKEVGSGGGGCPGPGSRYDKVVDSSGNRVGWSASMQGNPSWDKDTDVECIEHVEIFPDYLDYAIVNINLNAESRQWILTDLAAAYPGAGLKRPDWQFAFSGPGSEGANGVVTWIQLVPDIQVADPGTYSMRASGRTTGTPVSPPRTFEDAFGTFLVELLRVTLIEAP